MADSKNIKQYLDLEGLVKVFQLISNTHYTIEEMDEKLEEIKKGGLGDVDITSQLAEYLKSSDAANIYATKEELPDTDSYPDKAEYVESGSTKVIKFSHGDTVLTGMTIDASEFVKDGMVEKVELVDGENGKALQITFNVDASTGDTKDVVTLELGDLFDADNYYTKTEADAELDKKMNVSDSLTDEEIKEIYDSVINASSTTDGGK